MTQQEFAIFYFIYSIALGIYILILGLVFPSFLCGMGIGVSGYWIMEDVKKLR